MSDPNDQKSTGLPTPTPPPAATEDTERQTPAGDNSSGVGHIIRRWKREDFLKRVAMALRCIALVFSLLAFIIMASNKHGDWKDFDKYEEYRYVLAIAILSTLYTGFQVIRQIHQLSTSKEIFSRQNIALLEFFGDQLVAYLLLSAASSAVPLTNRMRENNDNIFTDSSASAIGMEFLAFLSLALSALIAGFKLSNHTYI